MSSISDALDQYIDKLVLQYRDKPKARATVAILGKQIIADNLANQIALAFSLDTAVGVQLDILGKYIGTSRNIGRSSTPGLFSLWPYSAPLLNANYQGTWDPATDTPTIPAAAGGNMGWWYVAIADGVSTLPIAATFKCGDLIFSDGSTWARTDAECGNGLTTYADAAVNANGVFWSYAQASRSFSALTDDTYRTVLKLKAILNRSDATLPSIVSLLATFFPGLISVVDNTDMTLTYRVVSTIPISVDLLASFLPRPMGVGINIIIVNPTPGGGGLLTTEGGSVLTTEGGDPLKTEP